MSQFLVLLSLFFFPCVALAEYDGMYLTFMEYNCENLFDCRHDTLKNDYEFLPDAKREWNFSRFWRKLNDVGRVIEQGGISEAQYHLPDFVAMLEVENDSCLIRLTRTSMLKGVGYRYVMTSSPDMRGVDVALLYNPLTFRLTNSYSIRINPPKNHRPTRDILYAKGMFRSGDSLHIFVIHAPSRSGGQQKTEGYRLAVASRLLQSVDSIRAIEPAANIIIAGDFNDYSRDKSLKLLCSRSLVEASLNARGRQYKKSGVYGTYKYQGDWDSLDHIFLTESLSSKLMECFILDNWWMLEEDAQGGYKPFRTYLGTFYHRGVSDHLPLIMKIRLE